jgi:predicted DNA-binding protein with PD1-like motif
MKVMPLRLQPGDDLRLVMEAWMGAQQEQAGCVISAVGSLSLAQLRLAGATQGTAIHGELEILSLSGTLSHDGIHLHIAIADSSGTVIGGHLCAGSLVRTTAELVIGLLPEWRFRREWIQSPAAPSCGSVLRIWAEGRQPPLHLQKHQPGHPSADAANPVAAQQLHDRHRSGANAQTALSTDTHQKTTHGLLVHCHGLVPAQRIFRLAEGRGGAPEADRQRHRYRHRAGARSNRHP